MPYEIVRYNNNPIERRTSQEVAAIGATVQVTALKIHGIGHVVRVAINEEVLSQMALKVAEEICPNGAEGYAQILAVGRLGILSQVQTLGGRLDRI